MYTRFFGGEYNGSMQEEIVVKLVYSYYTLYAQWRKKRATIECVCVSRVAVVD